MNRLHIASLSSLSLFGTSYRRVSAFAWLAYVAMISFGLANHVYWADESDPWNMVSTASWSEFWAYFAVSGHPPLWYLLLWPVARSGLPLFTYSLLHGAIAAAFAWQVLFRSPFATWFSILLLFSHCLGYQYAVITRGYALMTLLAFLTARFYPTRHQHPCRYALLLALLFNTESFIIVPTALLALFFTLELHPFLKINRKNLFPVAIAASGAALALALLWPSPESLPLYAQNYFDPSRIYPDIIAGLWSKTFWHKLTPYPPFMNYLPGQEKAVFGWALAMLLALAWQVRRTRWLGFYAGWLAWCLTIYTYLYHGYYWHFELLLVFSVWTLWLYRAANAPPRSSALLAIFLIPMLATGIYSSFREYNDDLIHPLSGGKDMAEFLRGAGYANATITTVSCYAAPALAIYLPEAHFWYANQDYVSHFTHWGSPTVNCVKADNTYTPNITKRNHDEDILLLSKEALTFPDTVTYTLLHHSDGRLDHFYMYFLPRIPAAALKPQQPQGLELNTPPSK